ncbi:MAG: tRNA (adenosine(37)-N6)-dimethylallyltransferase MiaA [bacterium]|nr:tRNA (adenosine(37)-N6)-dimethylallyltransferase MiaA [bacterium]
MIIVIVGPTGVGKTKLSIELAKQYHAEIINADSMQVYKELNIGTAKITEIEKENIPHHLFDICEVEDPYTVYDYQKDCRSVLDHLLTQNKNVIIVGGTGLYIKAALYNYKFKEEPELSTYDHLSNQQLVDQIKSYQIKPSAHINNRKRLIRELNKLENHLTTEKKGDQPLYDFHIIGLTTDRENLYNIINDRVDNMIKNGLLTEVKTFYDRNIYPKSIQTGIGYKELYPYFRNEISLEEAIARIKKNSRHYAKRQYTFFNHQLPVKWFETNYQNFTETIAEIITYLENSKKEIPD